MREAITSWQRQQLGQPLEPMRQQLGQPLEPMRQQLGQQEQPLELVQEQEPALLFYRKQPGQQQRSQLPKREICS